MKTRVATVRCENDRVGLFGSFLYQPVAVDALSRSTQG